MKAIEGRKCAQIPHAREKALGEDSRRQNLGISLMGQFQVDHQVPGDLRWALLPSVAPGCSSKTHLFGPTPRVEGDGESQLRGDALDRGADPGAAGGCGFRRLVLILSIAGRPPPEWG